MSKKKAKKKVVKKAEASKASSKKPARSPKSARSAGLQFEREVANALRHIFPEAERELEFQASQSQGVDLKGTGNLRIQCKNHQGYVSVSTINEVRAKDGIPVLVTQGVRQPAMAVISFENFVLLLEAAFGRAESATAIEPSMVEAEEPTAQLELVLPTVEDFI